MLRLVLKPLLVILTLGTLVVAMFEVAGRVTFRYLDRLEPAVNRLLSSRGVHLTGLSGDWRMLDPVVQVARLDMPAGHLSRVVLEVDMVESALRGTLLARRFKVDDAEVTVEKHPGEPWRLRGASGGGKLDLLPILKESDQLDVTGRLVLARDGMAPAAIAVSYLGLNRGGEHRHAFKLSNDSAQCAGGACVLQVEFRRQDGLWPLHPGRGRLEVASDGFLLPRPVLGFSPLKIARLSLAWQHTGLVSAGALSLRAEQFDMPGGVTLALDAQGTMRGRDGVHTGSITDWRVEQGDQVWTLPPVAVDADAHAVSLWMPTMDVARATAFLRQALAAVEPAQRWLGALNPRGTAHNLRVSYGLGTGVAYAMTLDQLSIDGYKGVPTVRGAGGELFGYERGAQLNLNAQDMELAFPDVFSDSWALPYAQGVVQAWFGPGYFGVRGLNLRAEAAGTRAGGSFAMSRPPDREGQRLAFLVSTERMSVKQAQRFVPYKLPDQLKNWLLTAPLGGVLEHARLAYQGQFQEQPGELGRRIELAGRVRDGALRYDPAWPEVTDVTGHLEVAGPLVLVDVHQGRSAGARIGGTRVRVVDNASAADVSLDAEVGADAALSFLRNTPLSTWVSFIEPDWQADGPMRVSGELHVPLNADEDGEPAVRIRGDLQGVDVRLPGYRIALNSLDGSFRYRFPYQVDASGVTGRLFDAPVTIGASTEDDRVHLRFSGRAGSKDVWRIIDVDDPGVASGTFDFDADLGLGVANDAVSDLVVRSTLEGTAVTLPAGYGKVADTPVPVQVRLTFLPDYRSVQFRYRDADGWLHFDQAPLRGAIGFGSAPVSEDQVFHSLVLGGHVEHFDLEEVIPDDGGGTMPLPIRLNGLSVGEIGVGGFAVHDAALYGLVSNDNLAVTVDSRELTGALARTGEEPMQVSLTQVTLPTGEDGEDPLTPDMIAGIPAADVDVHQLELGADDYGSWHFQLRPVARNLEVHNLEATVRGVKIDAPEGLVWRGDSDETSFEGTLDAGDLAKVLPQWGYAPSVETERAFLSGAFTWSGSPLMVDLLRLRGEAHARARRGRFLDVETGGGALKIFSLLNFTAIAKRVTLNFSDVFGRGVSFDDVNARFSLNDGELAFLEPMKVEGTGSEFRVTGTVDLAGRRLDNEMIVTLPVSKSLPWYAAYVALANPLAGLGVLVGERVLRKPLEQFSSARYRISGTLDDPDVKFVSVFDVSAGDTQAAVEGKAPAPGDETDGRAGGAAGADADAAPGGDGAAPAEHPPDSTNGGSVDDRTKQDHVQEFAEQRYPEQQEPH